MFSKKSGNQRMCRSALPDECFCLDCLRPLDEETTFTRMFLNDDVLCSSCRSKWLEHKKIYNINGINYHVLYEYDENLESFFFRYKEQRDIVLAPSFLHLYKDQFQKTMKKYMV